MNSLPPLLCPCIGFVGVIDIGSVFGDCGGDDSVVGFAAPAGLNEKSGRALIDFCLWCGMEPRRPAGYAGRPAGGACSDTGRDLVVAVSVEAVSGPRMGKENSGLGRSSMGPALDCCRRW
jgi:hypothetical protein